MYSIYTVDRARGDIEDDINRKLTKANRKIALIIVVLSFTTSTTILLIKGIIPFGTVFPFIIGLLYSRKITINNYSFRIKEKLAIKNITVASTWAGSAILYLYPDTNLWPLLTALVYLYGKVFIGSVIYDFKDVKGDCIAGLNTLPVTLGKQKTIKLLLLLHIALHSLLFLIMYLKFITFPIILFIFSISLGILYILLFNYAGSLFRDITIDGEWILFTLVQKAFQLIPIGF